MSNKDNILKLNANRSTEMTLNPSLLMFFFGGNPWEFLVGVSRPVLQILSLFHTKQCKFPHPFLDLAP